MVNWKQHRCPQCTSSYLFPLRRRNLRLQQRKLVFKLITRNIVWTWNYKLALFIYRIALYVTINCLLWLLTSQCRYRSDRNIWTRSEAGPFWPDSFPPLWKSKMADSTEFAEGEYFVVSFFVFRLNLNMHCRIEIVQQDI